MFLSRWSVQRPIAMTALIIVLVMIGISLYPRISIDLLPNMEIPTVLVRCEYQGASPTEIEVEIVKRIEDAVSSLDGIKHITSMSIEDEARIQLEFNMGTDVDVAATDIREALNRIREDLPDGANEPTIRKIDTNATTVAQVFLVGDRTQDDLYDYADDVIADRFSSVPGVGEVRVYGANEMQIHVLLDREKLTAMNLSINDVVAKLEQNNVREPLGRIQFDKGEKNVTFDGDFKDFEQIRALEVGKFKNKRVYLRDVAEVKFMSREVRSKAYVNGQPAARFRIVKKGEANAIEVINGIRQRFDAMVKNGELPTGMELVWFTDSGAFIQASVDDAWSSIVIGVILTAAILFAFLHEVRSTFIVAVSMPVSIVVSFWVMQMCGFTFNMFTLLALGTSVGTLVTNSIVVIENIAKKLDQGMDPKTASDIGAGEVAVPVFASAMTNVVVFGPIAMMTSLVGRFLVPFAITMTIATLVSLFVSFTLTPILASIMLRKELPEPNPLLKAFNRWWDAGYGFIAGWFNRSVHLVCRHGVVTVLLALALFLFSVLWVVPRVGMTFVPEDDQGEFIIKLEFPTDYSLESTLSRTLQVEKQVRQLPAVLSTATVIGKVQGTVGQASEGVYLAEITVVCKPKTERLQTLDELRDMFREALKPLSNCIVTVNIPSSAGGSSAQLELEIVGSDLNTIEQVANTAANNLKLTGKARDVDTSVRVGKPEIKVVPHRAVLQNLDLPSSTIGTLLRGSVEGLKQGTYKRGARSFDIRVKLDEKKGYEQLPALAFSSKEGKPLALNAISTLQPSTMPIQINRTDRERVAKVYANPAPKVGLQDLVTIVTDTVNPLLPPGYKIRFGGQVTSMTEAFADFAQTIVFAIVLTYLLIAAIMESWTRPFLIMFTVPLALIGMELALLWAGIPLSIFGLLGFVMLIGIVVNNAILIMDDLAAQKAAGLPPREAMLAAVGNKFRPILMTSIAAVLGIVPMAFGAGIGSETRASCGIAVIGGLVSSTILALYVIPALYILFSRKPKKNEPEESKK